MASMRNRPQIPPYRPPVRPNNTPNRPSSRSKKNRPKADRLWIGFLVGLIIPVISACVIFPFYYKGTLPFWEGMQALFSTKVVMVNFSVLCLFPNAAAIFAAYKFWLWDTYKGILMMTFLLLIPILVIRLIM
jgi:hypothetical protein